MNKNPCRGARGGNIRPHREGHRRPRPAEGPGRGACTARATAAAGGRWEGKVGGTGDRLRLDTSWGKKRNRRQSPNILNKAPGKVLNKAPTYYTKVATNTLTKLLVKY